VLIARPSDEESEAEVGEEEKESDASIVGGAWSLLV
jgi:hypothetical protein